MKKEAPTGFGSCLGCAGSSAAFLLAVYAGYFLGAFGLVLIVAAGVWVLFCIAQLFTK